MYLKNKCFLKAERRHGMNLYIKQKAFSWRDRYQIYDENGEPYYEVEGEMMAIGAKLHLNDMSGKELFYIHRKFSFMRAHYEVYQNERLCASIYEQFHFLTPKLLVESDYGNFEIDGQFMGMDFTIRCNDIEIGSVHKKWMTWSDCYELTIADASNVAFFCALVIAIDNCLHNGND